jgi:hypothetical protein
MRDGAIIALIVLAAAHASGVLSIGVDAFTYWSIDPLDPYTATRPGVGGAFFYSPAAALLAAPFKVLPWQVFIALWSMLLAAALVWQAGLWSGWALLMLPVFSEVAAGNIHLLLGAMVVIGFRYPAVWAFALLTKITPGVGLLWFLVRREWRNLGIALGVTAAIAAASFVIVPGQWFRWFEILTAAASAQQWPFTIEVPLVIRLAAAAALITWGALTDRRWTVAVGSTIALPVLWVNGLAMLVAALPLLADRVGETPASRWLAAHEAGPARARDPRSVARAGVEPAG